MFAILFITVCQHSCHKVESYCSNNTECVKVWADYHDKCKEIISWDGVSMMPTCSSECMRWIDELDSNPIGKYLKCCSCNEQDESKRIECIKERQKVSIVCDIDYNSIRYCEHNESLCDNHLEKLFNTSFLKTQKVTIQGMMHFLLLACII